MSELVKIKYADVGGAILHNHVGCGMTLLPEHCMNAPTVTFEAAIDGGHVYSLLMIDMDIETCLWAV